MQLGRNDEGHIAASHLVYLVRGYSLLYGQYILLLNAGGLSCNLPPPIFACCLDSKHKHLFDRVLRIEILYFPRNQDVWLCPVNINPDIKRNHSLAQQTFNVVLKRTSGPRLAPLKNRLRCNEKVIDGFEDPHNLGLAYFALPRVERDGIQHQRTSSADHHWAAL